MTLMSQKIRGSPRKSRNCLPRRSHSAVDLKRLLPARAVAPKKKRKSPKAIGKGKLEWTLVGHNLTQVFPIPFPRAE